MSATAPFEGKSVADEEDRMRIIPAMSKMLAITLTAGFVLAGCTTERPADYRPGPGYSEPVSPALREHRRRQRIRRVCAATLRSR